MLIETVVIFCYFVVLILLSHCWQCSNVVKADELGLEIAVIALPALLALASDPLASLVDTAFIGHIGINICMKVLGFL